MGLEESSLDRLLGEARRGDTAAREAICRRILPSLRRFASRRLPTRARGMVDTDDLTQDALARTLDHLQRIEIDAHGLVAYLRTAVLNRIRDEIRQVDRRPVGPASLDGLPAGDPSPLDQAIGAEAAARYERALQELPARERGAVILRLELDFGYAEIAAALGWASANAVRMAVTRAIDRMASRMSDGRE